MQGHQHLLLGTVAGIAGSALFSDPAAGMAFCGACMLGSVYPDIDIGTSKLGKKMKPASALIGHIFGHRGFIHTPLNGILLCIILTAVCGQILPDYDFEIVSGFVIGFFLHLIQDTFTRGGIMWLWPIRFRFRLTKLKSASPLCYVITFILAILVVMLFLWLGKSENPVYPTIDICA